MPNSPSRTLLIVDDHASFRSFAKAMLEAEGFEVTGEASDGESALEEAARLHPDVVLLDVQLGDGIDGFEVAHRLAAEPEAPVVVLTSSRDASDYGTRLADSPVKGFIPKRELSGEALDQLSQKH
jgi:DNA-binding NarL/FixJ family response regulator